MQTGCFFSVQNLLYALFQRSFHRYGALASLLLIPFHAKVSGIFWASKLEYPVFLDFPPPELDGYTVESTIAGKFQAMVKLGLLNSRMKDEQKQAQWQGFINKAKLADAPASLRGCRRGRKGFSQTHSSLNYRSADVPIFLDRARSLALVGNFFLIIS